MRCPPLAPHAATASTPRYCGVLLSLLVAALALLGGAGAAAAYGAGCDDESAWSAAQPDPHGASALIRSATAPHLEAERAPRSNTNLRQQRTSQRTIAACPRAAASASHSQRIVYRQARFTSLSAPCRAGLLAWCTTTPPPSTQL